MISLDLDKEDKLLELNLVHLGFAAESEIRKSISPKSVSADVVIVLHKEAQAMIVSICDKGSVIVRNAGALNPKVLFQTNNVLLKGKMKKVIQKIVRLNISTFVQGDNALTQYSDMLECELTISIDLF